MYFLYSGIILYYFHYSFMKNSSNSNNSNNRDWFTIALQSGISSLILELTAYLYTVEKSSKSGGGCISFLVNTLLIQAQRTFIQAQSTVFDPPHGHSRDIAKPHVLTSPIFGPQFTLPLQCWKNKMELAQDILCRRGHIMAMQHVHMEPFFIKHHAPNPIPIDYIPRMV
jgi:hypothetical protein